MSHSNPGHCPCCDQDTRFVANSAWWRDHYLCSHCGSIPRERALMHCIEKFLPAWREADIHESSPVERGATQKLRRHAPRYVASQYFPDVAPGLSLEGVRSENLERLTFPDASFDLHVTQDVLEHVFDAEAVFREIARTLRPGGLHVFTVPLVNRERPTEVCARMRPDGVIEHFRTPEYHGNPVSADGALVTRRWGFDICEFIHHASGLFTQMVWMDNLDLGIRAELIEVLITRKSRLPAAVSAP